MVQHEALERLTSPVPFVGTAGARCAAPVIRERVTAWRRLLAASFSDLDRKTAPDPDGRSSKEARVLVLCDECEKYFD
jgi:hypothetical protein